MSWLQWAESLRVEPDKAVSNLIRGSADVTPFERASPHEFLLAILPRVSRVVDSRLLGEPLQAPLEDLGNQDLLSQLDIGLSAWLERERESKLRNPRKISAYAAQVCEALQWPLYFHMPQTRSRLESERPKWISWLSSLTLTSYRDPEYDYWQVLASHQSDQSLQFFWHSFVVEAGRTRSLRYLDLGLLALAKQALLPDDSLRNLRLQVHALVDRYARRTSWGAQAMQELASALAGVLARNPSLSLASYDALLRAQLKPLGDARATTVLELLGLASVNTRSSNNSRRQTALQPEPPGQALETDQAVRLIRASRSLVDAWSAMRTLLAAHEEYFRRTGDSYYFVRNLDRCARSLCARYELRDPELRDRLVQWIYLGLQAESDNPRLWLLWELVLRRAGYPHRAKWVLWEMIRRFPDQLHGRVELARLLASSGDFDDSADAQRLLDEVLQLDPEYLHAHSTLAQMAIDHREYDVALLHARKGLAIEPEDSASVVLVASALARRGAPGDLQSAILELQRFVTHYPGHPTADDYLGKLLRRQQLEEQGKWQATEHDDQKAAELPLQAESDPAWQEFEASIARWVFESRAHERVSATPPDASFDVRRLPLAQAMLQSLHRGIWSSSLLNRYEPTERRELLLETSLWHLLEPCANLTKNAAEYRNALSAVAVVVSAEAESRAADDAAWANYLSRRLHEVRENQEAALPRILAWLQELLARHQPLPLPVLA